MSDLTDYTEGLFRDWMSQGSSMPAPPGTIYVGLHTSAPGESPDGSTEVSAADYDRVGVSAGTGWNTPGENDFQNANEISFGTTQNDWGNISHASLWDASSTGNCIAAFALDSGGGSTPSGIDVSFPAGDLSFSLD
jgi:hypothetical protein